MWDISALVTNPLFLLVVAGIGALFGYAFKVFRDVWRAKIKHREELATHVVKQIEKYAPAFYLMVNYSHNLAHILNEYLEVKCWIQMQQDPSGLPVGDPRGAAFRYDENSKAYAKYALFPAVKLYSVMSNRLWNKGGVYILPDRWANQAIDDLHNELVKVLTFDAEVLLKYVNEKTPDYKFYNKLKDSETDETLKDLQKSYREFEEWMQTKDSEVKKAAAFANAYSDLFSNQMVTRLYKDWYDRGFVFKPAENPLKAPEVTSSSSDLCEETRVMIRLAAQHHSSQQRLRSKLLLRNIENDKRIRNYNSHFEIGWKYYAYKSYDMAIEEYTNALREDPGNAIVYNNLGNVYADFRSNGPCPGKPGEIPAVI